MKVETTFKKWWSKNSNLYKAILFDVDGTIISGRNALPGAIKLLQELRSSQFPFCLLTNDGNHSAQEKSEIMRKRGLDVNPEDLVSCGHALTPLASRRGYKGKKFFAMGELGVPDFAEDAGIITIREPAKINSCMGVIIGEGVYNWQENINAVINYYINTDNRIMIVPNPDSYWPSGEDGEIGIGAGGKARFVSTILKEYGIKIKPYYLGKPYKPVYRCAFKMLKDRFGFHGNVKGEEILMLGDSLLSDIRGANMAGYTSGLVLTGISNKKHVLKAKQNCKPDLIFQKLG